MVAEKCIDWWKYHVQRQDPEKKECVLTTYVLFSALEAFFGLKFFHYEFPMHKVILAI